MASPARVSGTCSAPLATFGGDTVARVIDEDPPHHHGSQRHELRAIRPVDPTLIDQAHECFMDERGGLEGVIGALATHVARGEPPKLAIHNLHHPVRRVRRRIWG